MANFTPEQEQAIKEFLLTGICEQVKHEYDTEEDFEEKFGPTNTVGECVELICDLKCSEDIEQLYCPVCIDISPENYKYFLNAFGCELDEIGEHPGDYKEYITWGYDKDNDVWEEYYRGIERDVAIQIAKDKTAELEDGTLIRVCSDGHREPIDWVEAVYAEAEDYRDYFPYIIWSSYGINRDEITAESERT